MRISDLSSDVCSSDLVDRPRPPFPPGAGSPTHLVELSLARLDPERPGAPPRSYVGLSRCREAGPRSRGSRALPELGATVRPCAARDRVRHLNGGRPDARTLARAIDSPRRGWPIATDGTGFLAVVTPDVECLADRKSGGEGTRGA